MPKAIMMFNARPTASTTQGSAGAAVLLLALAILLGGCSAPRVRGLVMEGQGPGVMLIEPDDPRLQQDGLEGVMVELTLDPNQITPKTLGRTITDLRGRFEMPVDALGAGFLEYELAVQARAGGYQDVWQILPLPKGNRWLLVIMAPGRAGTGSRDILKDTLRLNDELMNR